MKTLANKTIFITGSSRGIGREIALRCAREGANIVIAAKSAEPHPKLPGTIHSVAKEVEDAGGKALAIKLDVRSEAQIEEAMQQAVELQKKLVHRCTEKVIHLVVSSSHNSH